MADTAGHPHFESAETWKEAAAKLAFAPREPRYTSGRERQSIRIHVRDHKLRVLDVADRTLEAHYGAFVLSQARPGPGEAERRALVASYGKEPGEIEVRGRPGRVYELGPEPEDVDGRNPAVVTWHDGAMHYLVASADLPAAELIRIAESLYE